jgi:8-oxo-dGTP pyrophosphatase MutT (NUDIX family)
VSHGEPRRRGGNQYIPRPADWRAGGAAPWPTPAPALPADVVADRIAARPYGGSFEPTFEDARPSAVLVVLADGTDGAEVLLTRRSMQLSSHRGEVSFPGGRVDAGEEYEAAALREAHEEVGLHPDGVRLVGHLSPISTLVSRSWIVPVVARIAEPIPLVGATAEVDRVLWVPLRDLTMPGTFREEFWRLGEDEMPLYFFELDDETVWGATARMLHQLLRVAHDIDDRDAQGREPPAR